jgi:hypothetical protein
MNAAHDFTWRFLRLYMVYFGVAVIAALGFFLVYELIVFGRYLADTYSLGYFLLLSLPVVGLLIAFASFGRSEYRPMVLYGALGVAGACFAIVVVSQALFDVSGGEKDAALGLTTVTTLVGLIAIPRVIHSIHKVLLDLFKRREKNK